MLFKVPQSREDITIPWLNTVFQKQNIQVQSFKWLGTVDDGLAVMGCLERLTLEVIQTDKNNNQELKTLTTVVKTLPTGPAELRHFIINEGFCQRELKMYTDVFPAWEKFQDSRNTPQKYRFRRPTCYYGAEEGEGNDYRMIIIMEDMFSSNFQMWPHGYRKGLKWKQVKSMVKQIANFHAVGMAYKEYQGIKNYSEEYPFLFTVSKDQEAFKLFLKSGIDQTITKLQEDSLPDENSLPIPCGLVDDLKTFVGEIELIQELKFPKDGRAGTICHHDLHVNNIMMPLNPSRGDAAILDFQGCCYSSPMNDLTFFLMLNCDPQLFTSGLPKVLRYYHEVFQAAMKSMGMDLEYSLEQITEDYTSCVILSVIHIIMGAPSWCFGPRTSQDTWKRFKMALIDTYHRSGLRLSNIL